MEDLIWKIAGNQAELNCRGLTARLDLGRPDRGFANLTFDGVRSAGTILGITVESGVPGRTVDQKQNDTPVETYVRANQLIATYAPTVDRPVGYQIEWEAHSSDQHQVALDAMVSVQTPLLETYPEVLVDSHLDGGGLQFHPLHEISEQELTVSEQDWRVEQPGCSLLELVAKQGTTIGFYAEMVHPADFLQWSCRSASSSTRWQMCDHFMEKGVIRRLRSRGLFLIGHDNDAAREAAREQLVALEAEQPPLTA